MPYVLTDLVIDRVDLVDEGANSAAFIELYKRKETVCPMELNEILSKMKPEHASVISHALSIAEAELTSARTALDAVNKAVADKDASLVAANEALEKANAEIEMLKAKQYCECDGEADEDGVCKSCGKTKKSAAFDETETLKGMPEGVRAMFEKMRAQKEAAEDAVRRAVEREAEAAAAAKAASMKALPVEQSKLVGILKSCTPEVADILETISKAIETTVLDEVGKSVGNGAKTGSDDAWSKLEKKAAEIAVRDSVTKEKAMTIALDENPELYREYLSGGAK